MVLNLPLGQILYWGSNWASTMALSAVSTETLNATSNAASDLSVEQALDLTVVIPTFNGCDRSPKSSITCGSSKVSLASVGKF
ncbi:MAG: hypothetical protein HC857_08205 [Synechococcales cyanobacterium RU_4_20]|nr:hypothetical protein [Synechococcales cyanobacterium RU_4_20]NJR68667.1 hypothetical protein [Synechococcales cyanobacterium CRU_2_2]